MSHSVTLTLCSMYVIYYGHYPWQWEGSKPCSCCEFPVARPPLKQTATELCPVFFLASYLFLIYELRDKGVFNNTLYRVINELCLYVSSVEHVRTVFSLNPEWLHFASLYIPLVSCGNEFKKLKEIMKWKLSKDALNGIKCNLQKMCNLLAFLSKSAPSSSSWFVCVIIECKIQNEEVIYITDKRHISCF